MSPTTSGAPAAPRTWFSRTPDGLRDPDREAFLALGAVIVTAAAPLVLATAGVAYLVGRAVRVRWWWPAVPGVVAAAVVTLVYGPAGLAARYGAGIHNLWQEAHVVGFGTALRGGWTALLGALAPLSIPVGLVAGAVALGYAELRRPAWRSHPAVGKQGRRRERERSRLTTTTDVLTADGRFPVGVDTAGEVVHLVEADLSAHAFVAGASRSGKTTALVALARAVVCGWGRPLIYVDLKGDPDVIDRLRAVAEASGKPFWAWSLEGDAAWNPLAHGDPSLLKDKLVGLERFSEPHYQRAAERFLQLVFTALAARPDPAPPTLAEVVALLDPQKLGAFARSLPAEVGDGLWAYVDSLTRDQLSGVAGLATRLALLTESTAGPWLQPKPDDDQIDLATVARAGGVVVLSLDSGRWPGLSAQVGALVVQDLKAVCGQALHGPRGSWYVMIDEFSALDGAQLLGLLARGAAAGCSVVLATQELADLNAAGDGFRDQVLGNAALKAAFRQDVPDSAELWAAMAGTEAGWAETIQTAHRSAGPVATATGHATGTGSLRQVEQYRVHPNTIKTLPQGRCLLIRKHPAFTAQVLDVVIPTAQTRRAAA